MRIMKLKTLGLAIATAITSSAVVADHLETSEGEPIEVPSEAAVSALTHGGTGCPQGSVAVSLSDDYQALSFSFDSYVVEVGPGVPINQSRKFCQVSLDLSAPAGWQYGLGQMTIRGYADLESGVNADVQAQNYFSGSSVTSRIQTGLTGPTQGEYELSAEWESDDIVWSPCGGGRALNLKSSIALSNNGQRNRRGLVTAETGLVHVQSIVWRRCE